MDYTINVRGRLMDLSEAQVMGILNVTPDSFYDGSRQQTEEQIALRTQQIVAEGGRLIDVGAYSTRPDATAVSEGEEMERLRFALPIVRREAPDVAISVDTFRPAVARMVVEELGADIINDISGGQFDEAMFQTVANLQVPYILMHNRALPSEMQQHTGYDDIVDDLTKYFSKHLDTLYRLGVKDVWIDPGFGFAKSVEENFELLHRLDELTSLFREPLLTALSRKSMIYRKLGITPDEALNGTVALDAVALAKGSRLLRVHDPKPAIETIKLLFDK